MIIKCPTTDLIPSMKAIWQESFFDTPEFIDAFFDTAFSPDRCRVASENGEAVAALYIFDFCYMDEKVAYIYAVATAEKHRGRGICRRLMENTYEYLKDRGYAFAILKPGDRSLFDFYGKMGHETCGYIDSYTVHAADVEVPVRPVDKETYGELRRKYLPENGLLAEGVSLDYLASFMKLYEFDGGIFTAYVDEDELFSSEILTDGTCEITEELLGGIVNTLECTSGAFRTVGDSKPFVMGYPLCKGVPERVYLGVALD